MRALLIANPNAGRVRGTEGVVRVVRALKHVGFEVELICPERPEEIAEELSRALPGCDPEDTRVVVAGGDGTVRLVLPAVMNTGFPLAILPVGSVNVLARELQIPFSVDKAASIAAEAHTRRIDLGLANGRPFACNLGLGFDAAVVHAVRPHLKHVIGTIAYVADGLSLLSRYRSSSFTITADDETVVHDAWLAVITNVPRYTYWHLSPGAAVDDGWLDLCLLHGESLALRSRQVLAVLSERHGGEEGVQHLRSRRFQFQCDPCVHVQLDGDPVGMTPLEVVVVPQALTVVVPG